MLRRLGRRKRQRTLADRLTGDRPEDQLLARLHRRAHDAPGELSLVVDGDSVGSLGWPHVDVASQRGAVVTHTATFAGDLGLAPSATVVFFDATVDDVVPRSNAVGVELLPDRIEIAGRVADLAAPGVEVVWGADANGPSFVAAGANVVGLEVLLDAFLDLDR